MDLAKAAADLNDVAYGYISSWAVLTASRRRVFDRLPASAADLVDEYPDPDLVDTWMLTLAQEGLVEADDDGVWDASEEAGALLVGDGSYADYLGGQILGQLAPRLVGGDGVNPLEAALVRPDERGGYEGWFADADEAERYQASQYAGSLLPGRTMARELEPSGPVLDLGGGWGAVARAVAERHDVEVDVVDLDPVVGSAPPVGDADVAFVAGNALDPDTWPERSYDGAILSYLFSSVPGETHEPVLDALAERDVQWVAVHDFLTDGGSLAPAWALQHAVFVPGHVSRSVDEVGEMLDGAGFGSVSSVPVVDEMTTMVVGARA
ncbi:MAG: methyltransferase [Actinomycetota bacterium]